MTTPVRILLPFACLAALAGAEENLLRNGALALADGAVAGWSTTAPGLAAVDKDLPAGISAALQVTIAAGDAHSHGQIVQRIPVAKAGTRYRIAVWTKAAMPRAGYVQAKFYGADRKELKRITLGTATAAWTRIDQVVDAGEAAAVEVLLRWIPDARYDRTAVLFADALLATTDAPVTDLKPRAEAAIKPAYTVALVGDSTVQAYPERSDRRGWGEMLAPFLSPQVQILNRAAGGRSTATFRSEGLWTKVLAEKPDLVLIQFGHNDSHEPGRPESTEAATTYADNLRRYVSDAKDAGIAVVLVTPPPRRVFAASGVSTVFRPYVAAMHAVAAETGVPCIDLYDGGCALLQERGEAGSIALFCSEKDRSHFSAAGALAMARLVAEGLLALGDATRSLLRTSDQWPAVATAAQQP